MSSAALPQHNRIGSWDPPRDPMAPDENSDDETLDMAHATVIEGADLESDTEVDLPSSAGPPGVQPPYGSYQGWSSSNPVGIPSSVTSNHSSLSIASSFFSPSSVSKYAPHAFEPSSVSSSYQTAEGSVPSSVNSYTPQAPQQHSSLQHYGSQQGSSFNNFSTGTSFAEPFRRYGAPMSTGNSYSRHGSLPYLGPNQQMAQPIQQQQPQAGFYGDNRYETNQGVAPRRSLLTSMLQQKPGSTRGSTMNMSPRRPSDAVPYARVTSNADLTGSGMLQRSSSRTTSLSRSTSQASSRRPSVIDMEDADPGSPDLDPTSVSSSMTDAAPMFIPSRSISTTNVSRTMVSTSTSAGVRSPGPQAPPQLAQPTPQSQQGQLFSPHYQPFAQGAPFNKVAYPSQRPSLSTVSPALSRAPSISLDDSTGSLASRLQLSQADRLIEAEKAAAPGGGRSILPALAPVNFPPVHMDIANHDVSDVIEMVTLVLSRIVASNDALYPPESRGNPLETPGVVGDYGHMLKRTLLSFHGCNVPDITLRAYLARILKYCPATSEVFIAILVYFDRISRRLDAVSALPTEVKPSSYFRGSGSSNQLFVLDSYNVHRLIIASVTVASKFSSDIFYKNSRYAKVGGLPVEELNHLELQLLVLCDFKLLIGLQEIQHYADFLLKFRQQETGSMMSMGTPAGTSTVAV